MATDQERAPTLSDALETIRDEYGDTYPEWLRFANDASEHAREQGLDVDFGPPRVHFPIVRYQQIGSDQVRRTDEITADHVEALKSFATALLWEEPGA